MGPILFLINRNSPYYKYYGLYDGKGLFKLENCSWYVYGAILQQGEYGGDKFVAVVEFWRREREVEEIERDKK